MSGIKHLIQCHCVLPQYRNSADPIFHKFVVFSKLDENNIVIPKLCKCNNCEVVHKIVDLCKSEVSRGNDSGSGISSISDIRSSLPDKICEVLDTHKCDKATWEEVEDIIDNEEWNSRVVISKQSFDGSTQIKLLVVKSLNRLKIETSLRQDDIGGR
jgi:hypothetical protein